jgi:hypothetical protein
MIEGPHRDRAIFNRAIGSKLRGCDGVTFKLERVAPYGDTLDRAAVRQNRTGGQVQVVPGPTWHGTSREHLVGGGQRGSGDVEVRFAS